jgi:Fic family protein
LMEDFVSEFIDLYDKIDKNNVNEILKYWYKLHIDFVKIHPFIDWNGRTARLLMNLWFYSNFWFIDVIYMKNRAEYIKNIWDIKENYTSYYEFMNENFEEFLEEFLPILEDNIYYKI